MTEASVDLFWLPLGAGGGVVPRCGRAYERLVARRQHRRPQPLFHSALELVHAGTTYVIEMAPVWSEPTPDRGVVVTGPVGLPVLGRSKAFRYEVRCWPGGRIPDRAWAVESPVRLSDDPSVVAELLTAVGRVPTLTWGRDELGVGDMWNSNSLVSWLLTCVGIDSSALSPPEGGRAPGWRAGVDLAGRRGVASWPNGR